jgi:YD repeat-containing protein
MISGATTTDYDGMGRMKFWKNQTSSGAVLNEFIYSYNTANQIISITGTAGTRNFGYDNSDRLTTVTGSQTENYSYDDVGNRTSSHLSSSYSYQQGAFNRLTATQTATYSFDANGNVTSKTEGTNKWYYSYDRENRLTNATKFGGLIPRAGESINYHY